MQPAAHGTTFNDELKSVWHVGDQDAPLLSQVTGQEPWIGGFLESFLACPVVAATCRRFEQPPYFRLPGHRRAFYVGKRPGGGVVAVKGSELNAADVDELLAELAAKRSENSFSSVGDFFVFGEQKIPMALARAEAFEEAGIALAVHRDYFGRFGELPRLPFPLCILAWPEHDAAGFVERVRPHVSARAFELVELLARDGLAVYCYYYPGTPIRVREVHEALQATAFDGYAGRLDEIRGRFDPARTIQGWITLLVRLLGLGWLPVTLSHDPVGQAVRAQNVVADGGFVDVGSFQRLSDMDDDREVHESIWVMLIEMTMSLRGFLAGGLSMTKVEHHDLSVLPFLIGSRLRDALGRELETARAQGMRFDPRIEAALTSGPLFDDLDRDLRVFYPARSGN